jgi:hypothetical protein
MDLLDPAVLVPLLLQSSVVASGIVSLRRASRLFFVGMCAAVVILFWLENLSGFIAHGAGFLMFALWHGPVAAMTYQPGIASISLAATSMVVAPLAHIALLMVMARVEYTGSRGRSGPGV